MAKLRFTVNEISEALTKSNGFLSGAAKHLNCTIQTIDNYIKKFPALQELQKELKHKRDDIVENAIMKGITEGNVALIIFYAKTQMKHRGYTDKEEPNSNNQLTLIHNFLVNNSKEPVENDSTYDN